MGAVFASQGDESESFCTAMVGNWWDGSCTRVRAGGRVLAFPSREMLRRSGTLETEVKLGSRTLGT